MRRGQHFLDLARNLWQGSDPPTIDLKSLPNS
jgi:hypothetical protein